MKIEPSTTTLSQPILLDEDEELVGIYGIRNRTSYIDGIGFLVWRPPKQII